MKKLKFWGWQSTRPEVGQTREICAAPSKAAVARAANVHPSHLFNLSETGNQIEINVMLRDPGRVYWTPIDTWVRGEKND